MKLVIRPPITNREPLRGYVLRACEENGYPSQAYLLSLCGLETSYYLERCDVGQMALLIDRKPIELEKASYWRIDGRSFRRFGATEIAGHALSLSRPKVCVDCLNQTGCIDRLWDLQYYIWCHKHQAMLVDRCSVCQRHLIWQRASVDHCQCGAPLRQTDRVVTELESSYLQLISAQIAVLDASENQTEHDWPDLTREVRPTSLAPYLALLGMFGNPATTASWRTKAMEKPDVPAQLRHVMAAGEVLADWPCSLETWLDARRRSSYQGPTASLTAEFGRHLCHIRQVCQMYPAISSLIDAVRAALNRSPRQRFPLKSTSRFVDGKPTQRIVSASTAGRLLGITAARIQKLIKKGDLAGDLALVGGRTAGAVPISSIADFKDREARLLSFRQAGELLGISGHQVGRLGLHGIVDGRRNLRGGWRITHASLDKLKRSLTGVAIDSRLEPPCITLDRIVSLRTGVLGKVICAALSRRVVISHLADTDRPGRGTLSFFSVRLSDVARGMLEPAESDTWLSVKAAARALRVSQRMFVQLRRQKLLDGSCGNGSKTGKHSEVRISASLLEHFHQNFVLSRDIAAAAHTNTKRVVSMAAALGISPVIRSDNGAGISAVWRACDAAELTRNLQFHRKLSAKAHIDKADMRNREPEPRAVVSFGHNVTDASSCSHSLADQHTCC